MQLEIYSPTEEGFIDEIKWNHEEIKKEVAEKVSYYANLVYTDDQIKDAKADRAKLNKFVQALETKRKEVKKQCMKPYEDFEKKMKEIIAIVNESIQLIDKQVKGYEDKKKADKLAAIKAYWNSCEKPFEIDFEKVMDQKWLNASVSLKSVYGAIDVLLESITKDLATLRILPEFAFEAEQIYISTLDIQKAIKEANRMSEMQKQKAAHEAEQARLKAEADAKKAEEEFAQHMNPPETDMRKCIERQAFEQIQPKKEWISFKALLTTEDALALKEFFDSRNIEFKPL